MVIYSPIVNVCKHVWLEQGIGAGMGGGLNHILPYMKLFWQAS